MTGETSAGDRRWFLRSVGAGTTLLLTGCAGAGYAADKGKANQSDESEAEVTPGEDLMQEHGVLRRILLIYGEVIRRIEGNAALDATVVGSAAEIIRRFIENYHEKNEEQFVFPKLREAGREVETVAILLRQHERGRQVTDEIIRTAAAPAGPELARLLRSFVRMYRPHASREDTVVFPAFRAVMGRGYAELGEKFEDKERELLGQGGFEKTVAELARLEASLGIADLAAFTP
jgi:hemerythrin-like domain-containing protein